MQNLLSLYGNGTSRKSKMFDEWMQFFPLAIAGLTTLGGGMAWMMTRMDRLNKEERQWQIDERERVGKLFQQQIVSLYEEIASQNTEITQLRRELTIYVRHVGILEGLLKGQGIEPPPLSLNGS